MQHITIREQSFTIPVTAIAELSTHLVFNANSRQEAAQKALEYVEKNYQTWGDSGIAYNKSTLKIDGLPYTVIPKKNKYELEDPYVGFAIFKKSTKDEFFGFIQPEQAHLLDTGTMLYPVNSVERDQYFSKGCYTGHLLDICQREQVIV
jgi:hypothetical protein